MKITTFKLSAFLCALCSVIAFGTARAQVLQVSDLYGTYEFTGNVQVTEAGQAYADLFKSKAEVIISAHNIYDFSIVGIGGATEAQGANLSGSNIVVRSINGANYYLWGNPVIYADGEGNSPYAGNDWDLQYTVDPATKTITLPDFTAITVDASWTNSTVLAKFTNCKLTFKAAEVIEADDISGNYHFKAAGMTAEGSTVPTEFDLTLEATNPTFTAYDVTITYEGDGYAPLKLAATFDGVSLVIPFKDAFIDEAKTLALASFNVPSVIEGELKFKAASATALTLDGGMCISKGTAGDESVTYAFVQFYSDGSAVAKKADLDIFEGTYTINSTNFWPVLSDYTYNNPVVIEISKREYDGAYVLSKFDGQDVVKMTYGGKACTVEGNTLKIPAADDHYLYCRYLRDDYMVMDYDILHDGMGQNTGTIDLTLNEDGTWSISDFFLMRKHTTYDKDWNPTIDISNAAFYGTNTVEKAGAPEPINFAQEFHLSATVTPYLSDVEYPEVVDFDIILSEYNGKYYLNNFMGTNVYNMTYGSCACESEGENVLYLPTGETIYVRQVYMADDFSEMQYDVLCPAEGAESVKMEVAADGSITMSDFLLKRKTTKYNTEDWSVMENTLENAALYTNVTVAVGASGVQPVAKSAAAPLAYAKDGVIYVVGAADQVTVVSVGGAKVYSGKSHVISGLPRGIYVVKAGNASTVIAL